MFTDEDTENGFYEGAGEVAEKIVAVLANMGVDRDA